MAGLDVDTAIKTANNAVDHNFLIAALPWLISAGLTAWAACDVYDTYKTQGSEAAVKQLVTMGIITAVTAGTGQLVYKIGSKVLGKTAEAAWKAYLAESPVLSKMIEKGAAAFGKVKDKVTNSKAFQQAAKLDAKLDKAWDKGKEKVSERLGRSNKTPKAEAPINKPTPAPVKSKPVKSAAPKQSLPIQVERATSGQNSVKIVKPDKTPVPAPKPPVKNAEPKNRAAHEVQKDTYREQMGRPHAEDETLKDLLEQLHKTETNCIGSGSTAAAVRHELRTGQAVKGREHTQKALEGIDQLGKWLENNPAAPAVNRAAAENMLKDLKSPFMEHNLDYVQMLKELIEKNRK